jgi:hypothetical protein
LPYGVLYEKKLANFFHQDISVCIKICTPNKRPVPKHIKNDEILPLLLRGIGHTALPTATSPTRWVMTLSLLLTLCNKIAIFPWEPLSKQVIWTLSVVAFLGSTRLGEFLASESKAFSPSSDFTLSDVQLTSGNSFLLRTKQPKSREKEIICRNLPFLRLQLLPG